ncbi:hypothetical protein DVA86_01940 [Streptomyces armeniacus]|uniref:Uncharacterized protein n=1 Tax=Streptomyces armeniacus TaxID=83291 RepID=A0A345XIX3_9ACTN|nr:hypothetical protein DVA86_01940 [Streptomyces armeniacus]
MRAPAAVQQAGARLPEAPPYDDGTGTSGTVRATGAVPAAGEERFRDGADGTPARAAVGTAAARAVAGALELSRIVMVSIAVAVIFAGAAAVLAG